MISARTPLYGIVGNPVRQSLSPVIHNLTFRRMGWDAVYLAFEVDDLYAAISGIRGLGIKGLSVTIPFKTEVIPFLDEVEGMAKKIKAVNTIVNEGGKLIGYNTDSYGAIKALEERVDLKGRKVLLLGAGGAARAIGYGLKERGSEIVISNRSSDRGKKLAEELGCPFKPLASLEGVDADILINATSAGMHPNAGESPLRKEFLKAGMIVMDIVYRPRRTQLLREAEKCGCQVIDGLEMLAYQGAKQLEIWTGRKPDVVKIKEDLHRMEERVNRD